MESNIKELKNLLMKIKSLNTKEEVFDLISEISAITENYSVKDMRDVGKNNDLYINPIWDIFHSSLFIKNFEIILNTPYGKRDALREENETIQLLLRLSFFMISVLNPVLKEETFIFIRRSLAKTILHLHRNSFSNFELYDFLYLEQINYLREYRFEKRTIVELNTDFLNMNQISSRILFGSMYVSFLSSILLSELVMGALHISPERLFRTSRLAYSRLSEYRKFELNDKFFSNSNKEALEKNLLLLEDKNLENVLFLVNECRFSTEKQRFNEDIHQKIEYSTHIKGKIHKKFTSLSVFQYENNILGDWSNKVFLNTIRFFSVLESVKGAKNKKWQKDTFSFFFNRWLVDLQEVVDYYNITEEISRATVYVEGLTDKIILETAYKKLYPSRNKFIFYDVSGKRELFKKINATKINDLNSISFGIFDFDDAYDDFNGLKNDYGPINIGKCLYRERISGSNRIFALLLPVPKKREFMASKRLGSNSMLCIELLFSDEILLRGGNLKKKNMPGGDVLVFSGNKILFAEMVKTLGKSDFKNFEPLFETMEQLLEK